jgi:ribosomal protein S19E (S16A)
LLFEGRRRIHHADELVTRMVARRLVKHLERAGFVVMKKPPARRSLCARARIWVSPIAL